MAINKFKNRSLEEFTASSPEQAEEREEVKEEEIYAPVFTGDNDFSFFNLLKQKNVYVIGLVLGALAISGGVYFLSQAAIFQSDPQKRAQAEIESVVAKVSKIMVLPEGEIPTVATVSDPEKLKDQPFFAKAKVGFKALVYPNARKAILYDPVENKIVEVAPVNIGK